MSSFTTYANEMTHDLGLSFRIAIAMFALSVTIYEIIAIAMYLTLT